ncbi:MAG TPA: hypothetical protein VGB98_09010 [Pyrinomonadaceae bacterium]|jgi:hypothetical protein
MRNRPTGVIRTLPYFGAETASDEAMNKAHARMLDALKALESGERDVLYIAFAQRPTVEVLHCYLIVEGKVIVRANISHFEEGDGRAVKSWDGHDLTPKWWAVLTAPVSWPEEPVKRRGFQGFRYTEDLW